MCCVISILLVFGSRLAIIVWWLLDSARFTLAARSLNQALSINLAGWVWGLLGLIFIPWTTLAYLYVFPGDITTMEWILLGIAFLVDLAGYTGGYRSRRR